MQVGRIAWDSVLKLVNDRSRAKGCVDAMFFGQVIPFIRTIELHYYLLTCLQMLTQGGPSFPVAFSTSASCANTNIGEDLESLSVWLMYFGIGVRLAKTASPIRASAWNQCAKQGTGADRDGVKKM